MNPPAPSDLDGGDPTADVYLGSEPLDPALADRFWFVVAVPGWAQLSAEDRRALVAGADMVPAPPAGGSAGVGGVQGGAEPPAPGRPDRLPALVGRVTGALPALEAALAGRVADYVVDLVNQLGRGGLAQSPRRARLLARAVVAVHAARAALAGVAPEALGDLEYSAEIAVTAALPQSASEVPPSAATVRAAHRHAWEVSGLAADDVWRRVLEEHNPLERVALGDRLDVGDAVLSRLVTQALGSLPSDARRVGAATAMFLALRERRDLAPSAFGPLADLAQRVLRPRRVSEQVAPGPALETWREISAHLARHPATGEDEDALARAYLLGGYPDLWAGHDWRDALQEFRRDLDRFGVSAAERRPR
jgi:MoxR-like ATPase